MLDYDFSETEITKTPDTDDQHSRHGGRSEVGFWELDWVEGLRAVAGGAAGKVWRQGAVGLDYRAAAVHNRPGFTRGIAL